jgi:hypothetical protein
MREMTLPVSVSFGQRHHLAECSSGSYEDDSRTLNDNRHTHEETHQFLQELDSAVHTSPDFALKIDVIADIYTMVRI